MKRTVAPASGIASAALVVIGILLLVQEQIDTRTDTQIVSYYRDGANRTSEMVGFAFVVLGALFFLWFLGTLRSRLQAAEPEPKTLTHLAFGAGTSAAALLVGAAAWLAATSFAAEVSNKFEVDPNLARLGLSTGFLFLAGWVFTNCVLVAATSVLALRTDVLPRWIAWVGLAAIVVAIVESFLFPVFVMPLWILVVSLVLLRQPHRAATTPTA